MSFRMLDAIAAIGSSAPVKSARGTIDHEIEVILDSTTTTPISACTVKLQGGNERTITCVHTTATLAIGSTAQRIKNTDTLYYMIDGTNYTVATVAAGAAPTDPSGTAITAAITDAKYGGVNVYMSTAGLVKCKVPTGYGVTTLQAFDDAATCLAALKTVETPQGYCLLGRAVVLCSSAFTFGTTALTGVTTFYNEACPYYDMETYTFDATDITNQRAFFKVQGKHAKYVRVYLDTLTGTGTVTARYTPVEVM
jgi:hypothetical protein